MVSWTGVIDASSAHKGWEPAEGTRYLTTSAGFEELREWLGGKAEYLLEVFIFIEEPSRDDIARVEAAARETGDISRLSPTDTGLLALASGMDLELITEDRSMQNTAQFMGIRWRGLSGGIRKVYTWQKVCTGCMGRFDTSSDECPVCGSDLKARSVRKKRDI